MGGGVVFLKAPHSNTISGTHRPSSGWRALETFNLVTEWGSQLMKNVVVGARATGSILMALAISAAASWGVVAQSATKRGEQASGARPQRMFISGHSLTDTPLPAYIAAIGSSLGQPLEWQQQVGIGSPIRWRTLGDAPLEAGIWPGYGNGHNRSGTRSNVLREFQAKANDPYDILIVAEGNRVLAHMIWSETVRHLRHFHDRFIEHNPRGQTYLFEPWETIEDKNSPGPWVALERQATDVWGCAVERINVSLQHEGRGDRVKSLPLGAALADLVDKAAAGKIPDMGGGDAAAIVGRIFDDDVHLTAIGKYYVALVVHEFVTGTSPAGAWRPAGVTLAQADALQEIAWTFREGFVSSRKRRDLKACRSYMVDTFCDAWNSYWSVASRTRQDGCKRYFGRPTTELAGSHGPNPFVFDPTTDAQYWYPAPQTK